MAEQYQLEYADSIDKVEDLYALSGIGSNNRVKRVYFTYGKDKQSWVDVPVQGDWVKAAVDAVDKHAEELLALTGSTSQES